ncbi:hypothetical protein [Actinomadura sp. GC306]|uniref:hypothetical protein n=1 Tax=Actinomadura sp. GC306 TaxID=2530367 RepID=UPI0014048A9F|nr:hypothetical protein [Actinomadura sp. GC306]
MYHHEIMRSLMKERVRERLEEARAERAGRFARRAREFWADRAERAAAARPVRRTSGRTAPLR